jgi:CheY-like chemotaxis protein
MLILHIDDDADDRALFLEAIQRIDISILHLEATDAINGLEVLAGSQVQRIDCIFLDINMPLMDGLSMLKVLKENPELKSIPVFIYSTTANPKEIESVNSLGGHFLQKRSDFRALISSLKEIFQHVFQHPQDTNDYFNRHWNSFTCSFRA